MQLLGYALIGQKFSPAIGIQFSEIDFIYSNRKYIFTCYLAILSPAFY